MSFIPDSEIQDNEILYRAIHPNFWNSEENRPTSALFKDDKGVSVDRDGNRTEELALESLLSSRDNYGAGKLNASEARSIDTFLKPDKIPGNEFHALIMDSESKISLTNGKAKKLSRMITILNPPIVDNK